MILDDKQEKLFIDSLLFKENIYSILDEELEEDDYLSLDEFRKIVCKSRVDETLRLKIKSLDDFLRAYDSAEERNAKILEAIYKWEQTLSNADLSYIVKRSGK